MRTFAAYMQYNKAVLHTIEATKREVLIARLSVEGYNGFEETDESLLAYIDGADFDTETLQLIASEYEVPYDVETLGHQNWNAEWEKNFQPVIVDGFCTVRADFHQLDIATPYEIIITPKMSFGTGHHATTKLMMTRMQHIDFAGKDVFDFGTGTGILAILAEKLGAKYVLAIDNDEWSFENSQENVQRNNCNIIEVQQGSMEHITPKEYDVILANINRHILLHYMPELHKSVNAGGILLMSGLLTEDEEIVKTAAEAVGFSGIETNTLNGWITLQCYK